MGSNIGERSTTVMLTMRTSSGLQSTEFVESLSVTCKWDTEACSRQNNGFIKYCGSTKCIREKKNTSCEIKQKYMSNCFDDG